MTDARVISERMVAIAFVDGSGAARVAAHIAIGTVVVLPPLESQYEITKSSIEIAKQMAAPATIAGVSSGSSTLTSATRGDAPRSAAASSYCLPIENRRP